jgi:hypothetical protein
MAIAMVTGSVSASRASGIDAASRSALAITTACNADWTRRRCMCRPEKGAAAAIKVLDSRLYRPRHPIRARLHGDDVGNGPGRALTDHQANPRRPAKWPAREAFVSAASQSSRRTKQRRGNASPVKTRALAMSYGVSISTVSRLASVTNRSQGSDNRERRTIQNRQ